MTCQWLTGLMLAVLATALHAQPFSAPEQIVHAGKTYKLAYTASQPDGRALYEYTTDDESIENWSSLVTLNYAQSRVTVPLKWIESLKASLDRETPKPHYSLYIAGTNGFAKIIYEPDAKNPFYESDVHKSFHIKACDGLLVYQFARKYPQSADQSDAGKQAALKQVAEENHQFSSALEKSDWLPACH
ncbi:hypothetical protein [Pseudomonas sp. Marseille-Q8238]